MWFLLSGNVNAAWYRDNVSRQVVMPFMPRHFLTGWGRGGAGEGGGAVMSLIGYVSGLMGYCMRNRVSPPVNFV